MGGTVAAPLRTTYARAAIAASAMAATAAVLAVVVIAAGAPPGQPIAKDVPSVDALEQPLVDRAPCERLNVDAKLSGVRGAGMGVRRGLTRPRLDDREVIGAHRVLQDVEPKIAGLVSARLGQTPEDAIGGRRRNGIDVRDDVDGLSTGRSQCRHRRGFVRPFVVA